ncbi:MAG: TonB C-terminal domain-containing protein [Desulfobacterales bacterium]|jgi:colicin import membrane protein|nr:TonB C-terminal domain-containing protein [Desulfobacteraceae bacterium]MBT4365280.1 TonB C-terminal domain-containing protein [Desulfobacteraceae bacterium]MBT7085054.1 TonB C-terminal domain-containing protein [Desulfobacterales bacterium]MBT7696783.1 TonB C-terminal domain-containing protein [Desulfobacterales bacterium]
MNKKIPADTSLHYNFVNNTKEWALFFIFSFMSHAIVLLVLIFAPMLKPEKRFPENIINVNLLSLSAVGPVASTDGPSQFDHERKKSLKKTTVKNKVPVSVKKKKSKKSLKKKTYKISKIKKETLKPVKKVIEKTKDDLMADAIEELKKDTSINTNGPNRSGSVGSGKNTLEKIDIYKIEIKYHIRKNWILSEQLIKGQKDLKVAFGIRILPHGEIKDFWFDIKSGNSYFDDSAYRAVLKSNPLPSLPEGYSYYDIGLVFTPEDWK